MFYLTMHSTHFIYCYMTREETHCRHMGYSFQLTEMVLLYAPSHRQDSTYHSLWYTGRWNEKWLNGSTMKDRSNDPSHYELPDRTKSGNFNISFLLFPVLIKNHICSDTELPNAEVARILKKDMSKCKLKDRL